MTESALAPAAAPPPVLTDDQTSGRMFVRWNAVSLALGVVALAAGLGAPRSALAPLPTGGDPLGFAAHARWDDGQAEVARYAKLTRVVVRAQPRSGAADAPGRDALELVALHERETLVTRVLRGDPRRVVSHTATSSDRFELLARGVVAGLTRTVRSTRDGEVVAHEPHDDALWLEDQLPLTLRALDPRAGPLQVDLLPTTLGGVRDARPAPATIRAADAPESVTTPAGTFECVAWTITVGDRALRYWVGTSGERPLVRYDDRAGAGELMKLERTKDW